MNKLQRWIYKRFPWLFQRDWPDSWNTDIESARNKSMDRSERISNAMKARYDRDSAALRQTLRALDAQVDVIAGTNRTRAYKQAQAQSKGCKQGHEGGTNNNV